MLEVKVDQKSVDTTIDYMEAVKQRIFAAIRTGMAEGMELLAANAVEEMGAAGIQNRTGALAENILKSPRVTEDADFIRGRVSAVSLVKARGGGLYYNNLGNILDMGFHDPQTKSPLHQFTESDGETFWARGHVAFDVKPHPFFRRAVEVSESPIMDIIRARVAEAVGERGV
jgi:hypothetical protein